MKTISRKKRLLIYLLTWLIYAGLAFAAAYPFIFIIKLHVLLCILICFIFKVLLSFLIKYILLNLFKGYTIITLLFSAKVMGVEEKRITNRQAFIRSLNESLLILLFYDLIYLFKNRTERGIIDRLTDTFMIDMRY